MKRFSKIILSVAAASTVAAAMTVSASAMTASYADGKVTLSGVNGTGDSQTLLVLDGENLTSIAETNIKQIDQKDDGSSFAEVPVGTLDNGTYEVRIGGSDGTLQTATFTVGGTEVKTKDVIVGDVNLDGQIKGGDLTNLKRGIAEQTTGTGSFNVTFDKADGTGKLIVGDINLDGQIKGGDLTNLKRGIAEQPTGVGSYKTTVSVIDAE